MNDERDAEVPTSEKQHPLLAAFNNMAHAAVLQTGVKALARAAHGTKNRRQWIDTLETQIKRLEELSENVLKAYDDGDAREMKAVHREIESIVNSVESVSEDELYAEKMFGDSDDVGEGVVIGSTSGRIVRHKKKGFN